MEWQIASVSRKNRGVSRGRGWSGADSGYLSAFATVVLEDKDLNCYNCHNPALQETGLDSLKGRDFENHLPITRNRLSWKVARNMHGGAFIDGARVSVDFGDIENYSRITDVRF